MVDLWGGVADQTTGAPYTEDTLQLVFSTTKGATAACANLLAQRGELDVDAPVAEYWPEFKAAGKADIPVRWLLCHKAGLPYVDATLTLEEALAWEPMVRALEAQAPVWEPGTAHGYHATTYGWLVGEVVKRISGKSLGTFFQDELAGPLGLEFWIGLPDDAAATGWPRSSSGAMSRRATEAPARPGAGQAHRAVHGARHAARARRWARRAACSPAAEGGFNDPAVRAAEIPAVNGDHQRPLPRSLLRRAHRHRRGRAAGADPRRRNRWPRPPSCRPTAPTSACTSRRPSVSGSGVASPFAPYGGPRSFGHTGVGGSVGLHGSGARPRVRLRDEQDGDEPQR